MGLSRASRVSGGDKDTGVRHSVECKRRRFEQDPPPLNQLWWHSASCEGPEANRIHAEKQIELGLFESDGPSYGDAIVGLIWRTS